MKGQKTFTPLRYANYLDMRNSKLYTILEQFNKYEQNRLRKFLQSPYFNRDEALIVLFDWLIADINNGKNNCLEKTFIWKQLQPGLDYDDVRFRKYTSDLTKLIEDFFCQQLYEQDKLLKANLLVQSVADKKVDKLQSSAMRQAKRVIEEYPYKSALFYYHNYAIENHYYRLADFETRRDEKTNFEEISTNLDYFYLSEKLRILCSILSRHGVVAHQYNLLIRDEVIDFLEKDAAHYETVPAVGIYLQIYRIYRAIAEPDNDTHYFKLKELLDRYALLFPIEEATEIYTYAQNYCIRRLNQGNQEFAREVVDLYKNMISKDLLVVKGELSPWTFRNAVVLGLRLGEMDWVEEFIHTQKNYLPESMRDNAVTFNLANLYFYKKQYDKVKTLLQEVEFEDFTYNLVSKSMLLATYYETGEDDPLYSLFESFRTYLNRHKDLPQARRQSFADLIKYTRKLTRLPPGDRKALQKLKAEVENAKNTASHGWLMEKIAELEH